MGGRAAPGRVPAVARGRDSVAGLVAASLPAAPTRDAAPVQASGRFGAHADLMNGWHQAELERLVAERDFLRR
jgi:hypothetical protein